MLLCVATAASWAAYSVAVAPLMRRYSPYRISAVVLCVGFVPLLATAAKQLATQPTDLGWLPWACVVYGDPRAARADEHPLVHGGRTGSARRARRCSRTSSRSSPRCSRSLILAEQITRLQIVGGFAVLAGIALARHEGAGSRRRTRVTSGRGLERLHADRRLGPPRAVGREREAGRLLLRARLRLHARGLRGAGDRRPRPRLVRPRAGRDPARADERAARGLARSCATRPGAATRPRTSRSRVPDAREAYRQAVQRGARGDRRAALGRGRVRARRAGLDRHLRRRRPHVREPRRVRGRVPPGLRRAAVAERLRRRGRAARDRPRRRQRRARPHGRLGRVLRARLRDDEHRPLRRRPDPDRVLGADVEGDVETGTGRSSSRSTSRPRASERARSRSTSSSTTGRACSTSRCRARTSSQTVEAMQERGVLFLDTPETYYEEVEGRVGEIDEDYDRPRSGCGSSPTATTTATCSRSSRRRRRTGRRCSSR